MVSHTVNIIHKDIKHGKEELLNVPMVPSLRVPSSMEFHRVHLESDAFRVMWVSLMDFQVTVTVDLSSVP